MVEIMELRRLNMTYWLRASDEELKSALVNFEFGFGRIHVKIGSRPFTEILDVEVDDFTKTCLDWLREHQDEVIRVNNT